MGTRNILRTTNYQHSKYPAKFNNVKEGKKWGPVIAYGRTHSYGSLAFKLSRFHCMVERGIKHHKIYQYSLSVSKAKEWYSVLKCILCKLLSSAISKCINPFPNDKF